MAIGNIAERVPSTYKMDFISNAFEYGELFSCNSIITVSQTLG